ncbi:unnamed protein product [Ceratitis capitata]|uniref:(Mediterranean fruit fly) hypothetical protein n=1 Tax=Ceratitis capitata TaxID=7213 RepID=A0A811UFM1_CERCA|nr:unnamed protein product [Ceratitis capitata]
MYHKYFGLLQILIQSLTHETSYIMHKHYEHSSIYYSYTTQGGSTKSSITLNLQLAADVTLNSHTPCVPTRISLVCENKHKLFEKSVSVLFKLHTATSSSSSSTSSLNDFR